MRAALVVFVSLVAALAGGCASLFCEGGYEEFPFTVVVAQLETSTPACAAYDGNLCERVAEATIAARLAELAPDVVVLQRVLPDGACDALPVDDDDTRVCHPDAQDGTTQLARLMPDGFRVACDSRNGSECVGVDFTRHDLDTASDTATTVAGCDDVFTVVGFDADVAGGSLRIVNARPDDVDAACRADELRQVFEGEQALAAPAPALVAAHLGIDPAIDDDESVSVWADATQTGGFRALSGAVEHEPPHPTTVSAAEPRVVDHVIGDGVAGSCVTLGATDATVALDDTLGVLDHRARLCTLTVRRYMNCE